MIDNPNLRAILFFRGGYGALRALDHADLTPLRTDPKWLAGFSDLTVVHYALRRLGVESIHGTMPSFFRTDSLERDTSALSLRDALFGRLDGYRTAPHPLDRKGTARGVLLGGNLSVLSSLNGTPLDDDRTEPVLLLLEDVGESIHHIDRMLQTLRRSGRLSAVRGIVAGDFVRIRGEKQWGETAADLVRRLAFSKNTGQLAKRHTKAPAPSYERCRGFHIGLRDYRNTSVPSTAISRSSSVCNVTHSVQLFAVASSGITSIVKDRTFVPSATSIFRSVAVRSGRRFSIHATSSVSISPSSPAYV